MTFRQPNNKEYLINERFKNAGYFELINGSLTLVLNNHENVEPAVYALVSGIEALYIGKTKNQVKIQRIGLGNLIQNKKQTYEFTTTWLN